MPEMTEEEYKRVKTLDQRARKQLWHIRAVSKNRKIPFNLPLSWFRTCLERGTCELTGLPFEYGSFVQYPGLSNPWAPSVDRIVPEKGYVVGNVRMIVCIANRAKSHWTDEELIRFARALVLHQSTLIDRK